MSTSVDNRVVELQFDNKNFEKNVGHTLKSLDKLEDSLRLKGAGRGLDELDRAASKIDFSKMSRASDLITKRLSTMGLVGVQVLNRIAGKAITTGEQMLKAFTIAPTHDGFAEYELKMGSVQTIVASTGESLSIVNDYLEELNKYSDKTIYSFKDMTASIGKFTNAGVPLEQAVLAIQGISNEAAVSGANAEEASRAMYNFSQALSAGYVKLIDWKSIENANMATREFKQELINTAVAMGTLKKADDGMYKAGNVAMNATKNFNDSLQKQWMTSEVLIETLRRYADETTGIGKKAFAAAQDIKTYHQLLDTIKESIGSGWAQISEIIFGDLDEAKKLWTSIGNAMSNFVDNAFGGVIKFLKNNLQSNYKKFLENGPITDIEQFNKDYQEAVDEQRKPIQDEIDANNQIIQNREHALAELDKYHQRLKEKEKNGGWFINDQGNQQWWLPEPDEIEHSADEVAKLIAKNEELEKQMADNTIQSDIFKKTLEKQLDGAHDRMVDLMEVGYSFDEALKNMGLTQKQYRNMMKWRQDLIDGTLDVDALVASFDEVARREKIFKALGNTFKFVTSVFKPVSNAFKNVFFNAKNDELWLGKLIDRWEKWSETLAISDEKMLAATQMFERMFGWVRNLGSWALPKLEQAGKKVAGIVESAAIATYHFITAAIEFINPVQMMTDAYNWVSERALDAKEAFHEFVEELKKKPNIGPVVTALQTIRDKFDYIINNDIVTDEGDVLTKGYQKFWYVLRGLPGIFTEAFNNAGFTVEGFVNDLKTTFDDLSTNSGTAFTTIYNYISDFVSKVKQKALEFGTWIKENIGIIISGAYVTLVAYRILKFVAFLDNILNSFDDFVKVIDSIPRAIKNALKKLSSAASFKMRAEGIHAFAEALLAVAEAIGIISLSIWMLSKLDVKPMLKGVAIISVITVLLVGLAVAVHKLGDINGAISLGTIAGAMLAIILAVNMITKIKIPDINELGKTFAVIGVMILTIGAIMIAINKFKPNAKEALKTAVVVAVAVFALYSVILAVKLVTSMSMKGEDLLKGLTRILSSLLVLFVMMKVLSHGSKDSAKAGLGLLAMSSSLILLLGVITIINKIKGKTLAKGVLSLTMVFMSLWVFMKAVSKSGPDAHKAGLAILAIGLAILPLVTAIVILSKLDCKKAWGSVALLIGIMTSLGIVLSMSSQYKANFRSLIGMVAVIATLGIIIGGLSALAHFVGFKAIITGVGALSTVLIALAASFRIMAAFTSSTWSGIGKFLVQISIMMLVVGGLTYVMTALSKIENPDKVLTLATVLGAFLAEMTVMMMACTLVGNFAQAALYGIGILLAVIVAAGAVVAGAAWLSTIVDMNTVNNGIELLNLIGKGIGGFIGGIGEGIMESASEMSTMFKTFCENISAGLKNFEGLPPNVGDTVASVAAAIFVLTAADLLDAIADFFSVGQDMTQLPDQMASIGKAIKAMATELTGIDSATINNVKTAADAASELFPIIKDLSDKSIFSGQSKIDSSKLKSFGESITSFASSIAGIAGPDAVLISSIKAQAVADAGIALADMAKQVPNGGGKIAEWFGDNKLDTFGEDLKKFAGAISELPDTTSKSGIIKQLAADGKELADMADDIPDLGGKWDVVFGSSSAEAFGKDIKGFADAINEVPELKVTTQTFEDLASIGTELAAMATTIPEIGGMWQKILGKTDAATFGENMQRYAESMNSISGITISTLSFYQLKGATDQLKAIFDVVKNTDLSGLYDYEVTIESFIDWLDILAYDMDDSDAILEAAENVVSTAVDIINDNLPRVKTKGYTFVRYFASGINSHLSYIRSMSRTMVNSAIESLDNYSGAYNAGSNFTQGFIDGITSKSKGVFNAAYDIGRDAIRGLKTSTKEHSPSKLAKQSGEYVGLGFVIGMKDYINEVSSTATDLGKSSIQALSDSIADIATVLNSDMEFQPTIRPVLDLSDVQDGAKDLDAIYNSRQIRGISNGVREIRSAKENELSSSISDSGINVSYVQNNYSPKALSRIDIYRQTKNQISTINQISTMKGIVTKV